MPVKDIDKATVGIFELLHSTSSTLQQIREQKYNGIVAADRLKAGLGFLLPCPQAAFYHGPRMCQQIQICKQLSDDPPTCGWVMEKKFTHYD